MQYIIIYIVLGIAVSYAGFRIYKTIVRANNDPCAGCEGCAFRQQVRKGRAVCGQKGK